MRGNSFGSIWSRVVLGVAVCAVSAGGTVPAMASAVDRSVTLVTDPGYWGQTASSHNLYLPERSTITVGKAKQWLFVVLSGPDIPPPYITIAFEAPDGEVLEPGIYRDVQRRPFRDPDRPGLEVSGRDLSCNAVNGSFEIKELVKGADDSVERAWIVYEQHCDGETPAVYGEIRVGMPEEEGAGSSLPKLIRWPSGEIDRSGTSTPVTFLAAASTEIEDVTISGPSAGDVAVRDECTGEQLEPDESCEVFVQPRHTTAGPLSATLTIVDAAGVEHETALDGATLSTRTEVQLVSDPLDWPGQGKIYSFTPSSYIVQASGNPSSVYVRAERHGHFVGWTGWFQAPAGETLAPGHYAEATRSGSEGDGPKMTVEAGYVCPSSLGDFTVNEVAFDALARVAAVDITFEQHCNGDMESGLRGSFRYRASDLSARTFPRLPDPEDPPDSDEPSPTDPPVAVPPRVWGPRPGQGKRTVAPIRWPPATSDLPLPDIASSLADRRRFCRGRSFAHDQIYVGKFSADRVVLGRRSDLAFGRRGDDRLDGGGGADCLHGGGGEDSLRGAAGRDILLGGDGADTLIGGSGVDRLDCGPGRDTVWASPRDTVVACERIIHVRR